MKNVSPVKLLVRRAGSKKFLRSTGRWTRNAKAACNFPNVLNAIHACLARELDEVELVLRFDGDSKDRCLRVRCC
ncbi:MAG TPA: hypothetical protein GYA07_00060 [Verrucomicrobia bacterium]|nr:hypothetical protein [Verrucomicrobiota bacterium]HOB34086.1 hypothetical protein [Verrucomicrobiota bacterium]HOP96334.1 hypothetical protein [Verrucomicrobiota bacterium]HPU55390.1 hypothetical protein [Verrucomicrobiota bacterium]